MPDITIEAVNLGKEYHYQTIFQQLSFSYSNTQSIAVKGDNGSGKSTLLRVLSGMTDATYGHLDWKIDGVRLPVYSLFEYFSFCSPDFHFDSRFTVLEILNQYQKIKGFKEKLTVDDLIGLMNFRLHIHKQMNELSSGMKQRVRLVLTICSDTPVLFLDEPCTNLDQQGVQWYNELIARFALEKLVFVASNDQREYSFCRESVSLPDYK